MLTNDSSRTNNTLKWYALLIEVTKMARINRNKCTICLRCVPFSLLGNENEMGARVRVLLLSSSRMRRRRFKCDCSGTGVNTLFWPVHEYCKQGRTVSQVVWEGTTSRHWLIQPRQSKDIFRFLNFIYKIEEGLYSSFILKHLKK